MEFEFNSRKSANNLAKHGIDFDDAIHIFTSPVIERVDSRRNYGETRIIAIGVADGREIVVIYTMRGQTHRIISGRRARRDERREYHQTYIE